MIEGGAPLLGQTAKLVWNEITQSCRKIPYHCLTSNESVEMDQLIPGICEKLEFRGRHCKGLQLAIAGKEARLRALWTRRLAYEMTSLPPFEQVFRTLRRTLRQANLP